MFSEARVETSEAGARWLGVTLQQRSSGDEHEVSVNVRGYLPRLAPRAGSPPSAGILYAKGQRPFHAAVSRRYFELLERKVPR